MKLAKLSLAAIVVAGLATSSFAADTLADAFKNGKVSGALKAYYFDRDDGTTSEDIVNFGLMLNYKTDTFNGFGLNFTGQTNHAPFANGAVGVNGSKDMFSDDEYGSGAVLSEAYISYTMKNTTVLVGRMFLDTPLVASSGLRMTKEAFEGAAIINTDLPNTTLIAGYVQKFQHRTDFNGDIGSFVKDYYGTDFDGAYTLAAINKSVPGLTLTAAYAEVNDVAEVAYAEAAYEGKATNLSYLLAAQYYYTDYDALLGGKDTNLYAVKAGLGFGAVSGYVAYSKVDKAADVLPGLGGGADLVYTGPNLLGNNYVANLEAYKVAVEYAINANATLGASYVDADDDTLGGHDTYTSLIGSYAFDGALKGLSIGAEYDIGGKDSDETELRIKTIYKF